MSSSILSPKTLIIFLCGVLCNMLLTDLMDMGSFIDGMSSSRYLATETEDLANTDVKANEDGWGTVNVYYGEELKQHPGKWYGQCLQDKEVLELLDHKRNGYFIDLAACVPGWSSNTLALEHDWEWNGLAMDADHDIWYDLSRRKCDVVGVVVGKNDKELIPYNFFGKAGGSGLVGNDFDTTEDMAQHAVPRYTASLINIFTKFNVPAVIDYFSLDVEGAEWFIMEHFPWDKYMFRVMTIERPGDQMKVKLQEYGYRFVKKLFAERDGNDFGEELWAHESTLNEREVMTTPNLR